MLAISVALEVAALSAALCRRCRPLVVVFAYALADELLIHALHLRLADEPRPFAGVARAAYHLETALVLGWPALLASVAWTTSGRAEGRWAAAGAWALSGALLVAVYPLPRGWTGPVLHVLEGSLVAGALAAGVVAFRGRRLVGVGPAALGALVAVELVVATVGAWGRDVFVDWDTLARVPHGIGLGVAIVLLWRSR